MISRIIIVFFGAFKQVVKVIGDNPNDQTVAAIEYNGWDAAHFQYGVDPTDTNIATMLAAYLNQDSPAAVFYRLNRDPSTLFAETATSPLSGGILAPHSWMVDLNYFHAQRPPGVPQATNAQTGGIWLQKISELRPDPPSNAVQYLGVGVDGWGDSSTDLEGWSRPSEVLISLDGDPTWQAEANLGINDAGQLAQSPWVVGVALADETIRYSDAIAGPWSFTNNNNPAGFHSIRTSNGEWTPGRPNRPLSDPRGVIRGQVQLEYRGQIIPPARYVVPVPFHLHHVSEVQVDLALYDTVEDMIADEDGRYFPVPWTPTKDMKVEPYSGQVTTPVFHHRVTSQTHISSPWGARWAIGVSVAPGGGAGDNQSVALTWMAANGGDADTVAWVDIPHATNPGFCRLLIWTRG